MQGAARRGSELGLWIVLAVALSGCYTRLGRPQGLDAAFPTTAVDGPAEEIYVLPEYYSPVVWGWYDDYYGAYRDHYVRPWWISHHGYPHHHHDPYYSPGDDFAPPDPPRSGFGRGGRDRPVLGPPGGDETEPKRPSPPTEADASGEKPPEETPDAPEKSTPLGGRGGRR